MASSKQQFQTNSAPLSEQRSIDVVCSSLKSFPFSFDQSVKLNKVSPFILSQAQQWNDILTIIPYNPIFRIGFKERKKSSSLKERGEVTVCGHLCNEKLWSSTEALQHQHTIKYSRVHLKKKKSLINWAHLHCGVFEKRPKNSAPLTFAQNLCVQRGGHAVLLYTVCVCNTL